MQFDLAQQQQLSFGDVFWEGVRTATGYTHDDMLQLPHVKEAADIKPCLETLDLVDVSWTDRATLQKLRDDLDHRLQCRSDFLQERSKRNARKFNTKSYIADKKYEAALQRDKDAAFSATDVLLRFKRIDFSGRGIKHTDADTMGGMMHVRELVLTDNDITVLTALPPMAQLAILASNEIHRVQLQWPQTALVALSLAGNCIGSLQFVEHLPNLSALDVSFNCITSVEGDGAACPAVLKHPKLAEMNLVGNPVTLLPDYRPKLEALLRTTANLRTVDGHAISAGHGGGTMMVMTEQQQPGGGGEVASPTTTSAAKPKPAIAVHFQVVNVKGFSDLSQRSFDLSACSSKCNALFYTPSMLDNISTQQSMLLPAERTKGGGGGGGGKAAVLAAQQAAAAEKAAKGGQDTGGKPPHEFALQQWCAQVATSLRVQALWMGEDRLLSLDELLQVTGAATSDEQQVALSNIVQSAKPPAFLSLSAQAAALQAQKDAAHAAQQAAIAQAQQMGSGGGGGGGKGKDAKHAAHRGGGGKSGGAAAAAAAELVNQKEQVVRNALQAASTEFVVPDPASALRPTLTREMMIPLRLGLVLSVTAAPGFADADLPVATIGWASLSPAELLQYHNTATVTAKVGADRATLLTARERVSKLTQQVTTIRMSLEKECLEYSWRRDTEFAGPASAHASGGMGGGAGGGAASSKRGGGARGGAAASKSGSGATVGSPSAVVAPVNAADAAAMDAFVQSQQQGRRRADETIRRLVLEMAVLNMIESLDRGISVSGHQQLVVEGRFALCKPGFRGGGADGGQDGSGEGGGGGGAAAGDAAGAAGKKEDGTDKKDESGAGKGGAAGKKAAAGAAAAKKRK